MNMGDRLVGLFFHGSTSEDVVTCQFFFWEWLAKARLRRSDASARLGVKGKIIEL